MKSRIFCLLLLCTAPLWGAPPAAPAADNAPGPANLAAPTTEEERLRQAGLVDVEKYPGLHVFVRLRYATPHNFTGRTIYDSPAATCNRKPPRPF